MRALVSGEGLAEWLATPWVSQVIGWWDMVSFRLVDFKINWKELAVQAAQASSSVLVAQVKGFGAKRSPLHRQLRHRIGHVVFLAPRWR